MRGRGEVGRGEGWRGEKDEDQTRRIICLHQLCGWLLLFFFRSRFMNLSHLSRTLVLTDDLSSRDLSSRSLLPLFHRPSISM